MARTGDFESVSQAQTGRTDSRSKRNDFGNKVSISSTFYEQLFRTIVLLKSFYVFTVWLSNFYGEGKLVQKSVHKHWII